MMPRKLKKFILNTLKYKIEKKGEEYKLELSAQILFVVYDNWMKD